MTTFNNSVIFQVSRTHDQDSDADLWRENSFFGRKITRYLCISKTEGIGDYIVEFVKVITEKEMPSDGYCLIARTIDSGKELEILYILIVYNRVLFSLLLK